MSRFNEMLVARHRATLEEFVRRGVTAIEEVNKISGRDGRDEP